MPTGGPFLNLYSHDLVRVAVAVPEIRVADPVFNAERSIEMRVGNLMRQPPRVWVESLPDAHAYVQDLLESVYR